MLKYVNKLPKWWNGIHVRLKIACESLWVRVPPSAQILSLRKIWVEEQSQLLGFGWDEKGAGIFLFE